MSFRFDDFLPEERLAVHGSLRPSSGMLAMPTPLERAGVALDLAD
jgi:hypothetical protein